MEKGYLCEKKLHLNYTTITSFPGPEFHLHGDKVETEGIAFSLVENIKDAFDVTAF